MSIQIKSLKAITAGGGCVLANCTVVIDGAISIKEACVLRPAGKNDLVVSMPRRSLTVRGRRAFIPMVGLSKELSAQVEEAVLKAWAEHQLAAVEQLQN